MTSSEIMGIVGFGLGVVNGLLGIARFVRERNHRRDDQMAAHATRLQGRMDLLAGNAGINEVIVDALKHKLPREKILQMVSDAYVRRFSSDSNAAWLKAKRHLETAEMLHHTAEVLEKGSLTWVQRIKRFR